MVLPLFVAGALLYSACIVAIVLIDEMAIGTRPPPAPAQPVGNVKAVFPTFRRGPEIKEFSPVVTSPPSAIVKILSWVVFKKPFVNTTSLVTVVALERVIPAPSDNPE